MEELKRKKQAKFLCKKYIPLTCDEVNSMAGEAEDFGSMALHIIVLLKRLYEWKIPFLMDHLLETGWRM